MNWTIVPAEPADAAELLALQHAAFARDASLYPEAVIPPMADTLEDITRDMGTHLYLKALCGDRAVGAVRGVLHGGACHVGRLMVHPEQQRLGLGRALLEAIEAHFPAACQFELFTGERSARNLRIYERAGYRATHRAPDAVGVTVIHLSKARDPGGAAFSAL